MKLYIPYILVSLLTSWVVLFYYGLSAGFTNYTPILALFGSLILFVIASPVLIYNVRAGSIIGLAGCILLLPFTVCFLKSIFEEGVFNWGLLLMIPSILILFSTYFTVRVLFTGASLPSIPTNATIKLLLAGIPIVLFILYLIFYGKYWSWNMFKI